MIKMRVAVAFCEMMQTMLFHATFNSSRSQEIMDFDSRASSLIMHRSDFTTKNSPLLIFVRVIKSRLFKYMFNEKWAEEILTDMIIIKSCKYKYY